MISAGTPRSLVCALTFLGAALLPYHSLAQVGGAAAFQTIPADAFSHALAEATVALSGYPGAATFNPAGIGSASSFQLGFVSGLDADYSLRRPWIFGLSVRSYSAFGAYGRWAFGYQYKDLDLGERESRDAQNNPTGSYRAIDRSHKAIVSYAWPSGLSAGAAFNLLSLGGVGQVIGTSPPEPATGYSIDLGVLYGRPFRTSRIRMTPSVGWSITDFGPRIRFRGFDQKDPLNMVMRGGASFRIASDAGRFSRAWVTVGIHGALSKAMVVMDSTGSSGPFESLWKAFRPIEFRSNPFVEEVAEYTTLSVNDQFTRHSAVDISILNIIDLRWGWFREHELNGNRRYDTFGYGIDLYYVAIEYAHNKGDWTGDGLEFWRITARIPIGKDDRNFWPALLRSIR